MSNQPQYLTPEGLKELEERLRYLKDERRPQVAERLRAALEEGGDVSENAEYEDAKNEQAFIEGEISRLDSILRSAQLIEKTGKKDVVVLGSKVVLVEQGSKEQEVYHLVGSAEANPREGKISSESPVGKAILGKKKGEKISVHTSEGEIIFTIKSVS